MIDPTRRQLASRLEDLEEQERDEWDDVERWRAFITGENPRTGEPISDERRVEFRRALAEFDARPALDPETDDAGDVGRGPGSRTDSDNRDTY